MLKCLIFFEIVWSDKQIFQEDVEKLKSMNISDEYKTEVDPKNWTVC